MRTRIPRLTRLDVRTTPAIILWDGGAGGTGNFWGTASNWVGDVVPGPNDDAVIGSSGPNIGFNGFAFAARTVTSVRPISLGASSTLTLGAGTSQFANLIFDNNSTLNVANGTNFSASNFTNVAGQTGTITIAAGETVEVSGTSDFNVNVVNAGTLVVRGATRFDGALSNQANASLRVVGSTVTVANGFTSAGTIQLTSEGASAAATLRVSAGTLIVAPSGNVTADIGAGGTRRLEAAVDIRGSLTANAALTIDAPAGTSTTSGTLAVSAGSTLAFADPLDYLGGTIGGGGTVQFQSLTLTVGLTATGFQMAAFGGTISGPGTLTVPAGQTLLIQSETINAPLDLQGTLIAQGASVVSNPLTVSPGVTVRVESIVVGGSTGQGSLQVPLTNHGRIELVGGQIGALATPVVNAAGGTIVALAPPGTSTNVLAGTIDNQGTITADADLRFSTLNTQTTAAVTNAGTIRAAGGDITVSRLTIVGATLSNTGTLASASGRAIALADPPTNATGTTLTGGTFDLGGPLSWPGADVRTLAATLTLDGSTANIVNSTSAGNGLANFLAVGPAGVLTVRNRTLTLPGSFTNSGVVTVRAGGTLATTAGGYSQTAGTTTVEATGTLDPAALVTFNGGSIRGTGTLAGPVFVNTGATISPGLSPGVLTAVGNVSLFGQYSAELNGPTVGTQYDQLAVTGTAGLGGTLNVTLGFVPPVGTVFRVIDNDGTDAVTGAFTNAANGSTLVVNGLGFTVNYAGGTGNDVTLTRNAVGQPPQVREVEVNDGATQRSRVTVVTVAFSTVVTLTGSPFSLTRIGGGGAVGFTATPLLIGGVTVVRLTGFNGPGTEFGSLVDGRYTLTVAAAGVSAGGVQLDGNGDGTGGDDYALVGSVANGLFRLFGDVSGDGIVNAFDFGQFRPAFGSSTGQTAYLAFLDYNNDGVINAFDFGQFRPRFGASVP